MSPNAHLLVRPAGPVTGVVCVLYLPTLLLTEPRAVPELKDTLQRVAGYCLHNYIYCPQTRAELARDKSVIEQLIKRCTSRSLVLRFLSHWRQGKACLRVPDKLFRCARLVVVANQHKERPLPQDCRMSPVYSLITVLSHMCQEGDSARYMGQGQAWRTIASPNRPSQFPMCFLLLSLADW